jgi:hypothetical protein
VLEDPKAVRIILFSVFSYLPNDHEQTAVSRIAELLGLVKVGWIFAHPPREKGYKSTFLISFETLFN